MSRVVFLVAVVAVGVFLVAVLAFARGVEVSQASENAVALSVVRSMR